MKPECTCLLCDSVLAVPSQAMLAEIISCGACGQEHVITELEPVPAVALAPELEEDWGE